MESETRTRFPTRAATRERNRSALLAAAGELALERGYVRTSVDAVAQRAGLTTGAVYSIFGSKQALFAELLEPTFEMYALTSAAAPGMNLRQALTEVGRFWAAFAQQPESRAALLAGLELTVDTLRQGEVDDATAGPSRRVIARFAAELEDFSRAAGEPLPRPAHEIATAVLGSMTGLAQMHILGLVPVSEDLFVIAACAVLS